MVGCGVIGNTADSGSVVLGSSPGTPASFFFENSLALAIISLYINRVARKEKINGSEVTEEQIALWAAEAEAGYEVTELKKRGRPGRAAEPSQIVALRLTADEIAALDERAKREGKSRSDVIRQALSESAA